MLLSTTNPDHLQSMEEKPPKCIYKSSGNPQLTTLTTRGNPSPKSIETSTYSLGSTLSHADSISTKCFKRTVNALVSHPLIPAKATPRDNHVASTQITWDRGTESLRCQAQKEQSKNGWSASWKVKRNSLNKKSHRTSQWLKRCLKTNLVTILKTS